MKVLMTREQPPNVIAEAERLVDLEVRDSSHPMTSGEARASLWIYDAVLPTLGDDYSAAVFETDNTPRCKILANFGVGYNHIDVEAARAVGVAVTNTPGAVTDATADIALTLMLMTSRRAGEGERILRAGNWQGWHPNQLLGMHMGGKTVGIIGMGRIGQAIAKRAALGFGQRVLFYNRSVKTADHATQVPKLTDLLAQSDIIVMAVPGGTETHHLMGAAEFAAMQNHALFINIARGDVVNEMALIKALQNGDIAGAGLDVYEHEPKVPDALIRMENVTLLPHLGTAALEVREAMGYMALENLVCHMKGLELPNRV